MKNFAILFLLIAVALLTSCEEDIEKRQMTFTASMPADDLSSLRPGSIINGLPDADGFNLKAQWKDGDKIQIFVRQDGMLYHVENPAIVSDISSDGKTCSLLVTLPKKVKRDKDYEIIGVTGVEAYIDGEDIVASCALTRVGIDGNCRVSLPMWFTAKKGSNQAKFRHLSAYEVLYVSNNSESSITFKHSGFEVMTPWYKYSDKVVLTNSSRIISSQDEQTDAESNEITIPAGETGTIVTCYIPRFDITDETLDATINNAKLKAVINSNAITTNDALNAYKHFARGNAYYMGVNWDGTNLYYSNEFCPDGNHPHAIDLGLPSGTKWACCNVGANTPAECGDYFAWGETTQKPYYSKNNYKWYSGGDDHNITKYCCNSNYGTVDNREVLEPEDDAAHVNCGPEWRMPSLSQLYELLNNCTAEWTKVNGMGGYVFKSNINGSTIFFPAGGWPNSKGGFDEIGTGGNYWLCSLSKNYRQDFAVILGIRNGNMGMLTAAYYARHWGSSVRAVHVEQ